MLRQVGLLSAILGVLWPGVGGALTVTGDLSGGLTPNDLVAELLGPGVVVSNVTFTGEPVGAGKFTGGSAPIGFEAGIILGSGNATSVVGPNLDDGTTADFQRAGDADLDQLIPGYPTFDATVLEFDFVPNGSVLTFRYVFASEEYNEYANTSFNDVFGFFVNGVNRALLPDGITVVSINNVNAGNIGGSGSPIPNNPSFYRNNDCSDLPCPNIDTAADGLTVVLALTADVNPGVMNHMKLAVADAGDQALDSWVFIQGGSLTVAENCTNLIDDDGDQLVDYDDPDCQVCGNIHLDPNEECDDGNLTNCDGCNANCTTPRCGDGIVCPPEACDPQSESATCGPGEICSGSCTCSCTQDSDCDDHNVCNGTELCAGASGCQRGTPLSCDDGDPCNGVETCDSSPGGGCVPASNPCDDSNPCNGSEVCTNNNGSPQCSGGTPPNPLPQECGGCCQPYYYATGVSLAVNLQARPDMLSAAVAVCVSPIDQVDCVGQYVPGATCNDGVCQASICGNGIIEPGEQCDDGTSGMDSCCNATTCQYEPSGTACADDNEVCTTDECNAVGECTHPNNSAPCDDGDQCTGPDICSGGACGGPPVVPVGCDDNNGCTDDGCSLNQCTHVNNTAPCEDGKFCTVNDMCGGGLCQPGSARDCAQGSACSTGSCDEENDRCVTVPDPGQDGQSCNDNDACTEGTTCSGGVCSGGSTVTCDDSSACTTDSCDPVSGCVFDVVVESPVCNSCDDGTDNDGDGDVDSEDCGCSTLCAQQRFALVTTFVPSLLRRQALYCGSDVTVGDSLVATPFPTGGVCTTNGAYRAGDNIGHIVATGSSMFGKGSSITDPDVFDSGSDRVLVIRQRFDSDGDTEVIKDIAPSVGPGTCSQDALQVCALDADCGAGNSCTGQLRLDTLPNPNVSRDGSAENYLRCVNALTTVGAEAGFIETLTGNVPGYTDATAQIRTSGSNPMVTVTVGAGQQVMYVSRVIVTGNTTLRLVRDPLAVGPDTVLVIRVRRQLRLGGAAQVQLEGIDPANVIWNAEGVIGGRPQLKRNSVFNGTLIAANRRGVVIGGTTQVNGAIKARRIHISQGATINHAPFKPLLE